MNTHTMVHNKIQRRKVFVYIILLLMIITLTIGNPTAVTAKKNFQVGLVFDPGGQDDSSINQLSYLGLMSRDCQYKNANGLDCREHTKFPICF